MSNDGALTFSIITAVRNARRELAQSLASIQAQDYHAYEWIVIDGASEDGTPELLRSCAIPRLRWTSEPDHGIYDAMNKGLRLSSGTYVVFLNAGDRFQHPQILGQVARFVDGQRPLPDIVFGGAVLMFPNGREIYRPPRAFAKYIWHGLPAIHQATYYRRDRLPTAGYDPSYRLCGDYYIAARLFRDAASASLLDRPLVSFEIGGLSYNHPLGLLQEAARVQREVLNLPLRLRLLSGVRRLTNTVLTHILAQPWSRL